MKKKYFLEALTSKGGDRISVMIQYSKGTMEKKLQLCLTDNDDNRKIWSYPLFEITAASGEDKLMGDLQGKGKNLSAGEITNVHRKICNDKFQKTIPVINVDGVGERVPLCEVVEKIRNLYEEAKQPVYVTSETNEKTENENSTILYMQYKDKDERELLFIQMEKFHEIMNDMGYEKKDIKECMGATGVLKRASGQTTYRYRTKPDGQWFAAVYMDMLDSIM